MTDTLSFPGLNFSLNLNPVALQITDTFSIKWYGILIAIAFLAGSAYIFRNVNKFGLDGDRVIDVLLGGVLGGIVGARLYYVAFSWDTYRDNLASIFRIWTGGIAIYGGIIGGVLVGLLICRWRKVKMLPMLDLTAAGLLLGQAIGRWGNFVNMEAFGGNTTLPWGMTSRTISNYLAYHQADLLKIGVVVDPTLPVHPTFLYESLWCLLGFFVLLKYTKHRRFDGELSLIYIGWYGLGRVFIEGLRTDSLMLGTLRVSQMVALGCVVASVCLLLSIRSRIRRAGDPDYLKLYVDTDEGREVLAGTFYKRLEEEKAASMRKEKPHEEEDSGDEDEAEQESEEQDTSPKDEAQEPDPVEDKESTEAEASGEKAEEDAGENNPSPEPENDKTSLPGEQEEQQ